MPEWFGRVGGATQLHPLGLAAVLLLGIFLLVLPRRWAIVPCLIIASFISSAQNINLGGLDFNFLRIMVVFGVIRLFLKKEYVSFKWMALDKAIIIYQISASVIFILQQGSFSIVVNRLGSSYDVLGMYFLFRCLIQSWGDVNTIIDGIIWISIPIACFFLLENRTGRNAFSIFGGVPEITQIREGRLRCQGAYAHPILAGCFWASLMPLVAAFWWQPSFSKKIKALASVFCALIIVICSASSTPVAGVLAAIIGALMFFFRYQMRSVRWGVVLMLCLLQMVMKSPVWSLVARFSAVSGGTGYHRYVLINGAITRFTEWALLGTKSTAHWGWGAQDITNQYVLEGVRGGFLTFCCFIAVIAYAFRNVGMVWRQHKPGSYEVILSWALGVSLFVHCVNFIGVSYFGQINILWYLLLAIIGSLSVLNRQEMIKISQKKRHKAKAVKP